MANPEDLDDLKKTFRTADNLRIKLLAKLTRDTVKYVEQKFLVKELAAKILEIMPTE